MWQNKSRPNHPPNQNQCFAYNQNLFLIFCSSRWSGCLTSGKALLRLSIMKTARDLLGEGIGTCHPNRKHMGFLELDSSGGQALSLGLPSILVTIVPGFSSYQCSILSLSIRYLPGPGFGGPGRTGGHKISGQRWDRLLDDIDNPN